MSDTYVQFTVYTEEAVSFEDIQTIMNTVNMIKGVRGTILPEFTGNIMWEKEKAKDELRQQLINILYPSYIKKG